MRRFWDQGRLVPLGAGQQLRVAMVGIIGLHSALDEARLSIANERAGVAVMLPLLSRFTALDSSTAQQQLPIPSACTAQLSQHTLGLYCLLLFKSSPSQPSFWLLPLATSSLPMQAAAMAMDKNDPFSPCGEKVGRRILGVWDNLMLYQG